MRKFGLPVLAIAGFLFGCYMVYYGSKRPPVPKIEFPPPVPPYKSYVAGSGIIEASSQNIAVGVPFNEIVSKVYVIAGDRVEKGAPLFELDQQYLKAEYHEAVATQEIAVKEYEKLISMPRPEEIPPSFARMESTKATYEDQKFQFNIYQKVQDKRAISEMDFTNHLYAQQKAKADYEEASGNYLLLKAGAWIRDLEISRAEVKQKEEQIRLIKTNLDRSIIRAPVSGEVLQVDVRIGESTVKDTPLVTFGTIDPLNIRVDIDQEDAWRFEKGRPATAFVRGNSSIQIPLEYVRTEPYIIPKKTFTGDNTERVDTRVLQVIYQFNKKNFPVYVGQMLDIYIEAKPSS
ncbi:MAG: efflux RND transporter periplasmic adaptor subunit [Simkaniaceae bacterium]|nr:efflux RND transporter periplasmic adaptor subunit [Simkaniaceae bacterium]